MNSLKCFLFIFITTTLTAQKEPRLSNYTFACTSGFYQLIENQLNLLSVNQQGGIEWQPILPPFKRALSAISYSLDDNFMYSFDTLSHELVRIYQSGEIQPLGIPRNEETQALLKTQLTIGEIGQGVFCAYSPEENLIYWVDITRNTFVTTFVWADEKILNLAYSPRRKLFCTVGLNSTFYFWDPVSKEASKGEILTGLSHNEGQLWITKDERFFATRRSGTVFYELDEERGMPYHYTTRLPITSGDATSCANGWAPSFIEGEVLELKLDAPKGDRIMLRWTGGNEYTTANYVVEHRVEGKGWEKVNQKPSSGVNNYQNPYGALCPYKEGVANYYRLKKVAHYGNKTSYSHTLAWGEKEEQYFIVSPQIMLENHNLSLFLNKYESDWLTIRLSNMYGQVIHEQKQQVFSSEIMLSLPVTNYSTGNYLLTVTSKKHTKQVRVWIQKNG